MNLKNILLNTDGYKFSHYLQYPPNARIANSYIESRGGKFDETVFFGLQMFIKDYLLKPFTQSDIDEAETFLSKYMPGVNFNRADWQYILDEYEGFLPITIEALPEGTVVSTKTVLVQVQNNDPRLYWLPGYIETALLRAIWYPTTVATYSRECKKVIAKYLEFTGVGIEGVDYKLHDFGARGVSSFESAGIGGLSHLVNFKGTDTVTGILYGMEFYNSDVCAESIPAAEHSTITSWLKTNEKDAYENMINTFGGGGNMFAVVTDSYDHFNAIKEIFGETLHTKVIENNGVIVFRPDSGKPEEIVTNTIEALMDKFGYRAVKGLDGKDYKILPDNIRVIQGDGISKLTIESILKWMTRNSLAADNVAFGMGAELLQKCNRDDQKFAMKLSAMDVAGQWRDVYKDPITDPGKKSKKGVLSVIKTDEGYETVRKNGYTKNELRTVYSYGSLLVDEDLEIIRSRALI